MSESGRTRGRPQIAGRKTPITITDAQRERIGRIVEGRRLGEFVREAIDNELDRRESAGNDDS